MELFIKKFMGDKSMLETIENYCKDNRNKMVKRVRKSAGSLHNAEDVVQNTLVMAITYVHSYDKSRSFDKWMSKILRNELLKYIRIEAASGMGLSREEFVEILETNVLARHIKTHKQVEVLDLYFNKGYKPKEIAHLLSSNVYRVEKIVQRFRKLMLEKLS